MQIAFFVSLFLLIYVLFSLQTAFGMIVNNSSDYPIGIFAVLENDVKLAKECGFEVIHNYVFEEKPGKDDELAHYLNTAQFRNLKVLVGFERGVHFNTKRVAERVGRFHDHPAVFGWYLRDEPSLEMKPSVEGINELIKYLDKIHPTIIAIDLPEFV